MQKFNDIMIAESFVERLPQFVIQFYICEYALTYQLQSAKMESEFEFDMQEMWAIILCVAFSLLSISFTYCNNIINRRILFKSDSHASSNGFLENLCLFLIYFLNVSVRFTLIILTHDLLNVYIFQFTSNPYYIIAINILVIAVSALLRYITVRICLYDRSKRDKVFDKMNKIFELTYPEECSSFSFKCWYDRAYLFNMSFYYPTLMSTGRLENLFEKYFAVFLMLAELLCSSAILLSLFMLEMVSYEQLVNYAFVLLGVCSAFFLNILLQIKLFLK